MKVLYVLVLVLSRAAVSSCGQQSSAAATPAVASIDPAQIKDASAWIAAYDNLLSEYGTVTTQLNGGNTALMPKAAELQKLASDLDAAAIAIKATLSGQELTDFEARTVKFKEAMLSAASN